MAEEKKTSSKKKGKKKKKPIVKLVVPKEKPFTGKSPKYFLKEKKNQIAYFDISIEGDDRGRIEIVLFAGIVKKTVANFIAFCTGKNKKKLKYKGTTFHRMQIGFCLQGGDILNGDGTGSVSIYGKEFDDENFKIAHAKYCISMANSGPNTNGSQFFISLDENGFLNGKHVVFGYITNKASQTLIEEIEDECSSLDGAPKIECKITKCGIKKKKNNQ
eukprot:458343_1